MESTGKEVAIYRKKPSRDWPKKTESIISLPFLSCTGTQILFVCKRAGLEVSIKGEWPWARIENVSS